MAFRDPFGLRPIGSDTLDRRTLVAAAAIASIEPTPVGEIVFGTAVAATLVYQHFASSKQSHYLDKANTALERAFDHLNLIDGLQPGDEDPDGKRRDWSKHAKKHVGNAIKWAKKVGGRTRRELEGRISEAVDRLARIGGD